MAHPGVVNEGYGFHIWKVVANILNKQSWTTNKGWFFSLRVQQGANNLSS
jgi:hypothetical protein